MKLQVTILTFTNFNSQNTQLSNIIEITQYQTQNRTVSEPRTIDNHPQASFRRRVVLGIII